jgi:hypothetical protein
VSIWDGLARYTSKREKEPRPFEYQVGMIMSIVADLIRDAANTNGQPDHDQKNFLL